MKVAGGENPSGWPKPRAERTPKKDPKHKNNLITTRIVPKQIDELREAPTLFFLTHKKNAREAKIKNSHTTKMIAMYRLIKQEPPEPREKLQNTRSSDWCQHTTFKARTIYVPSQADLDCRADPALLLTDEILVTPESGLRSRGFTFGRWNSYVSGVRTQVPRLYFWPPTVITISSRW